jgi:hypothetical protein
VRGSAATSASIPVASVGSGDRIWTRGSGEECRGRGVPQLEGKTGRERDERGARWRPAPFIAAVVGERGGFGGEVGLECHALRGAGGGGPEA